MGKTQSTVAEKLGIKRQAYANFETGEVRSTISLASLRRAAQAMDCELVYHLVPRTEISTPRQATTLPPEPTAPIERKTIGQFVAQADRADDELPLQLL